MPETVMNMLAEKSVDVALWALVVTLIIAVFNARRAARIEREENYIQLEMAANDLFRFEADHAALIEPFQGQTRPKSPPKSEAPIRAFIYQTLNLFEIAVRLRAADRVGKKIFGTWVIWFHDTHDDWYFRQVWPEMRENYTQELRDIFDATVEGFDPSEDPEIRKDKFFAHVSEVLDCSIVREWRNDLRAPLRADRTKIKPPKIRKATDADHDTIAALLAASIQSQASYISHGDYFAGRTADTKSFVKDLEQVISHEISAEGKSTADYALAFDTTGTAVGVAAYFFQDNGHETFCVLDDIAVLPEGRGQGVGQALFDHVEKLAKSQKAAKILLESGVTNHPAHRFFRLNEFQTLSKTFIKEI